MLHYKLMCFFVLTGSTSSVSEGDEHVFLRETSLMRYIVGSCQFNISSSAVHRIQRFIQAAQNHSYEPYSKTKEGRELTEVSLLVTNVKSSKQSFDKNMFFILYHLNAVDI